VLDPSTRVECGGMVILGGSPFRVVRLGDVHAAALAAWRAGDPVGDDEEEEEEEEEERRRFARRWWRRTSPSPARREAGGEPSRKLMLPSWSRSATVLASFAACWMR
jgi:hypothetical protein